MLKGFGSHVPGQVGGLLAETEGVEAVVAASSKKETGRK